MDPARRRAGSISGAGRHPCNDARARTCMTMLAGQLRMGLAAIVGARSASAAAARARFLPPPSFAARHHRLLCSSLSSSASSAATTTAVPLTHTVYEYQDQEADEADDPALAAVLERARSAVGGAPLSAAAGAEAVAFGTGTHLGGRATWSLRFRASDGAVREELRSKHLSFVWGSPGDGGGEGGGSEGGGGGEGAATAAPPAWEVDPAGVSKALELDDREALVLAALLRSGLWLDRQAGPRLLHMRLAGAGAAATAAAQAFGGDNGDNGANGDNGSASFSPSPATTRAGGKKAKRKLASEARNTAARAHPTAAEAAEDAEAEEAVRRLAAAVGGGGGGGGGSSSGDEQEEREEPSSGSDGELSPATGAFIYVDVRLRGAGALDGLVGSNGGGDSGGSGGSGGDDNSASLPPRARRRRALPPPGLTVARVRICPRTWRPVGYSQTMCGEVEVWRFLRWRTWGREGIAFPSEMHHLVGAGGSGGRNVYITRGVSAPPPVPAAAAAAAAAAARGGGAAGPYSAPPAPALPPDASYAPGAPPYAQAYRAPSGHVLVAGHLSAAAASPAGAPLQSQPQQPQQQQQQHWFLLDSGASGLVVDSAASRRLALPAIGELRVAGVAGRSRARLVRARELSVGPLAIRDPVLMEMDVAGLVRDLPPPPPALSSVSSVLSPPPALAGAALGHHPVAGIVGYDLFRRAIVDIPGAAVGPAKPPVVGRPGPTAAAAAAAASGRPGDGSLVVGDDGSSHSGFFVGGGGAAGPPSSGSLPALTLQQKLRRGGFVPVALRSPAAATAAAASSCSVASASGAAASSPAAAAAAGDDGEYEWLPMALVAYLPHVVLEFGVPGDPVPRRALFMLDTGASGADLMFHSRAAARLGLLPLAADGATGGGGNGGGSSSGSGGGGASSGGAAAAAAAALATPPGAAAGGVSFVRGVGGGDGGGKGRGGGGGNGASGGGRTLRTSSAELPWVRWGALRLEGPVRALVATQPGGLDLSRYASGIACADLLGRADVRLDYARSRVGMRRPPNSVSAAAAAALGSGVGGARS